MSIASQRELPAEYAEILTVWDRMARKLMRGYCFAGAASVGCSLFVATYTGRINDDLVRFAAFSGSALLAFIGAFNLGAKANAARGAWRLLHSASLQYRYDPTFSIEQLHAHYVAGENMIGEITFNGGSAPVTKSPDPADSPLHGRATPLRP